MFWVLVIALGLVACIAIVATMGLGMLLVGLIAISATFLVLSVMAMVCWAVIAILAAWDDLRAWWACVGRGRREARQFDLELRAAALRDYQRGSHDADH